MAVSSRAGSAWSLRVRMPSVTTSMRVLCGFLRVKANGVAHGFTRLFAERFCHPARGGNRGDPSRLEHDDAALFRRNDIEQGDGTRVVFPAPGGALKMTEGFCSYRCYEFRKNVVDGIGGHGNLQLRETVHTTSARAAMLMSNKNPAAATEMKPVSFRRQAVTFYYERHNLHVRNGIVTVTACRNYKERLRTSRLVFSYAPMPGASHGA